MIKKSNLFTHVSQVLSPALVESGETEVQGLYLTKLSSIPVHTTLHETVSREGEKGRRREEAKLV